MSKITSGWQSIKNYKTLPRDRKKIDFNEYKEKCSCVGRFSSADVNFHLIHLQIQ